MNFAELVGGLVLLAVMIGPLAVAACALCRSFLPAWHGAAARLVESLLTITGLTLVATVLGVVGLFGRWEMVALCVVAGLGCVLVLRRVRPPAPAPDDHEGDGDGADLDVARADRATTVVATLGAVLVVVQWLAPSLEGLRAGMQDRVIDTFWYHGPMAARFVQEGSITAVHYFDRDPVTAFFPGGSALLHAVGILAFGDDVASPVLNLAFLALALLAGWVAGSRFGVAPLGMLAVTVVLGTPMLVETQPGGAYNDVVGLALVMASVALLLRSERRGLALVAAGLAAGLAAGVKLTTLPTIGLLTVGVVVLAARGRRLTTAAVWIVAAAAPGLVWYLRNLFDTGSPIPGLGLSIGPVSLPELPTATETDRIASYLTDGRIIRDVFLPGLEQALGPAWWLLLSLALLGAVAVTFAGVTTTARMLGPVAILGIAAYLVQPQYLGEPGFPLFFAVNVRYVTAPLCIGLLSLVALRWTTTRFRQRVLALAFAAVLAIDQLDTDALWPAPTGDVLRALVVVVVLVGGFATVVVARRRGARALAAVTVAAAIVLTVAGLWWLQRDASSLRYASSPLADPPVVEAIRDARDRRIAIQGLFLQYALYGPDLSNTVDYLVERRANGASRDYPTCEALKRAVNRGDYDYLLVARPSYPSIEPPDRGEPTLAWAASSNGHGLREIARDDGDAAVYAVTGGLDPASCPSED